MDIKVKNAIISGVVIFLLFLILRFAFAFDVLISIGIAFLLGLLVGAILIAKSRGDKPEDIVKEMVEQTVNPDPDKPKKNLCNKLIQLNELIRLNLGMSDVTHAAEEVIDALLRVTPRAMTESANSTATYDLELYSTEYLADLLKSYMSLSDSDKESKNDEIISQLDELLVSIKGAEASLNKGKLDSFEISTSFMKAKTA